MEKTRLYQIIFIALVFLCGKAYSMDLDVPSQKRGWRDKLNSLCSFKKTTPKKPALLSPDDVAADQALQALAHLPNPLQRLTIEFLCSDTSFSLREIVPTGFRPAFIKQLTFDRIEGSNKQYARTLNITMYGQYSGSDKRNYVTMPYNFPFNDDQFNKHFVLAPYQETQTANCDTLFVPSKVTSEDGHTVQVTGPTTLSIPDRNYERLMAAWQRANAAKSE